MHWGGYTEWKKERGTLHPSRTSPEKLHRHLRINQLVWQQNRDGTLGFFTLVMVCVGNNVCKMAEMLPPPSTKQPCKKSTLKSLPESYEVSNGSTLPICLITVGLVVDSLKPIPLQMVSCGDPIPLAGN